MRSARPKLRLRLSTEQQGKIKMDITHDTLRRMVKRWQEENNDRQATREEIDAMIIKAAREVYSELYGMSEPAESALASYQENAGTFWLGDVELKPSAFSLLYISNALNEEAGEVAGDIKKMVRDEFFADRISADQRQRIALECGDVLFYLSMMGEAIGLDLERIAAVNIDKLTDRKKRDKIKGSGDNR